VHDLVINIVLLLAYSTYAMYSCTSISLLDVSRDPQVCATVNLQIINNTFGVRLVNNEYTRHVILEDIVFVYLCDVRYNTLYLVDHLGRLSRFPTPTVGTN